MKRRSTPSEHSIQVALMKWASLAKGRYPELGLLLHIPNGGSRHPIEAARLKAAGVKKGVPDLFLPVPRGGFHGLWVELKADGGRINPDQKAWLEALRELGYCGAVCWGLHDAIDRIQRYLEA